MTSYIGNEKRDEILCTAHLVEFHFMEKLNMGHNTYTDNECSDVTCHFNGNHILVHTEALGFALNTLDLRKLGIGNPVSTNLVSLNQIQSN